MGSSPVPPPPGRCNTAAKCAQVDIHMATIIDSSCIGTRSGGRARRDAGPVASRPRPPSRLWRVMHAGSAATSDRQSFTLPPAARAVAEARERVMALAAPYVADARLGDLRLVISEVITNAVRHGGMGDLVVAVTPKRE